MVRNLLRVITTLKREFSFIRGNILILMVSWVLMDFARPIPETYYSLFVLRLGGTPFIVGLIGFASLIALALVQFPGGYLADRYGRRKLIVTMTFGLAFSYIFYALAPTWHLILVGSVLGSLCLIYQAALRAITADSLPPEKRGIGFSVTMIVGLVSIASPLVAGFLYANYGLVRGMRLAYFMTMILFLAAATTRIKLRETLEVETQKVHFMDAVRSYPRAVRESMVIWSLIPRSAFYLFLIFTTSTFFASMCHPYYIIYATSILRIEEFQWALLLTWQSAVMFGSALPIGKLVDVTGRKKPLVASSLLFMLGMWLFIYGDVPRLILFFLLAGIGNSLISIAYRSMEADLVPRRHRGKVIGCTSFLDYILASVGQLIGGFIYESVSPQLPFFLLLTSTIPNALLTLLLIHEPERREM
ncbi:MAG: drug efflux system protein MdtG [Candidatus Bathyarchaeota archaeon BA1]|nr:MAG: drug efflux system protein MdtG [Candidatus Bathyarchaeota archaeon BA1]